MQFVYDAERKPREWLWFGGPVGGAAMLREAERMHREAEGPALWDRARTLWERREAAEMARWDDDGGAREET